MLLNNLNAPIAVPFHFRLKRVFSQIKNTRNTVSMIMSASISWTITDLLFFDNARFEYQNLYIATYAPVIPDGVI